MGSARRKGGSGNRGRPVWCEGSGLNVAFRRRHWRESDRVIRPLRPGNAGGGKDPAFWRAFEDGEVKVIGKSLQTPTRIRSLQRKLYRKAKAEPAYRFYVLYDKICREDILRHAYALARSNAGAPGVDGVTFADIDLSGREAWLAGLREELVSKAYRPNPVRRVSILKPNGGERPLGIPTVHDRVVQTAAKLVLEPIFEADFEDGAYGYRPRRSAVDAVKETHRLICRGYTDVVDADLSKYFDMIPHGELLQWWLAGSRTGTCCG